jgi:hypothetical protein
MSKNRKYILFKNNLKVDKNMQGYRCMMMMHDVKMVRNRKRTNNSNIGDFSGLLHININASHTNRLINWRQDDNC